MKKIKILSLSVLSLGALATLTSCGEGLDDDYGTKVEGVVATEVANAESKLNEYINSISSTDFTVYTKVKIKTEDTTDTDYEMKSNCKYDYDNDITWISTKYNYYDKEDKENEDESTKIQVEKTNTYDLEDNTYYVNTYLEPIDAATLGLSIMSLSLFTVDTSATYYTKSEDDYYCITLVTEKDVTQVQIKGDKLVFVTESLNSDTNDGLIVVEKKKVNLKAKDQSKFELDND